MVMAFTGANSRIKWNHNAGPTWFSTIYTEDPGGYTGPVIWIRLGLAING